MKNIILGIVVSFIIIACSDTSGKIKIINKSQNPIYYSVQDQNIQTIEGSTEPNYNSNTEHLDIGEKFIFWGDMDKYVNIYLEGETFLMHDYTESEYTTTTKIRIDDGFTRKLYIEPNHAGFKIINNLNQPITEIWRSQQDGFDLTSTNYLDSVSVIESGEEFFKQIPYSLEDEEIYHGFKFVTPNETYNYDYSNPSYNLLKDEQEIFVLE